jgi:hypothetical protein
MEGGRDRQTGQTNTNTHNADTTTAVPREALFQQAPRAYLILERVRHAMQLLHLSLLDDLLALDLQLLGR